MNLGKRIKELRKKKNLTQEGLAKILYVADKTISSWESSRTEPPLDMIKKLSEILECNISYLIYGDTPKQDIELEIKVKLSKKEYDNLKTKMQANAKFLKEINHLDVYYEPKNKKFTKNLKCINEWLRIGKRGNEIILNYKNWHNNIYCDEYEVKIDNKEIMEKILEKLEIYEIIKVNKKRTAYLYKDKYEIGLDEVENLGYFIEIENKKYDLPILEEYDKLIKEASNLKINLKHITRKGYPHILLEEKLKLKNL